MSGAPPGPPDRRAGVDAGAVPPRLAAYRATIDNLDAALVHLLAERFWCTQQVGVLKAELALTRKTGARGLTSIVEEVLGDAMFEVPSLPEVGRVVVDGDTVRGQCRPRYEEIGRAHV